MVSLGYVTRPKTAVPQVGIASFAADLPETATQAEVLKVVQVQSSSMAAHEQPLNKKV